MKNNIKRIAVLLILLSGVSLAVFYRDQFDSAHLQAVLNNAGAAAPLLFMILYALGTVFFLPGSVLTLLGGALFGPWWGTFYNLTAATIGAMLSFLIARYLASDWVTDKTGGKVKQLINGVENEGWRFVAFTRLVPLFPFNLLNYALGLTRISFGQFSIATYIFMLPGALAYTYLGYVGREALSGDEAVIQKALLAIALLAIVAFLPRLIGKMRHKNIISISDLTQTRQQQNLLVIDLDSDDSTNRPEHMKESIHIPVQQLKTRVDELGNDLQRSIILVSSAEKTATLALQTLSDMGYKNCLILKEEML